MAENLDNPVVLCFNWRITLPIVVAKEKEMAVSGEEYDVFLSYNSRDRDAVSGIASRLSRAGVKLWMDQRGIHGGERWQDALEGALRKSMSCAVFIGPYGIGDWQSEEVQAAINREKKYHSFHVIPVLLPDLPEDFDHDALPLFLRNRHVVNFTGSSSDSGIFQEFLRAIKPGEGDPTKDEGTWDGGHPDMPHSRTIAPAQISPLADNVAILQQSIKDRNFTPFIGAGCSLLGRSRSEDWALIGRQARRLLSALDGEDVPSTYLQRLMDVPAYDVPLPHGDAGESISSPAELFNLQLALTRLGAEMGALFASTMLETSTPVWDTNSYRVTISPEDPRLERISELLFLACVAAFELQATPHGKSTTNGLEASGLYDHLVELTGDWVLRSWIRQLKRDATRPIDPSADVIDDIIKWQGRNHLQDTPGLELPVHQLEWIADALWHAFRYDKAAYPRSDELAFQVSLLGGTGRTNRPEWFAAVQTAQVMLTSEKVAAWFQQYSETSAPKMHEFYDSLAHLLHEEFTVFHSHPAHSGDGAGQARKPLLPVAFSTNYDLEMERALQRVGPGTLFHVAIPVNAYMPEEQQPDIRWLWGKVLRNTPLDSPEWEWFPEHDSPPRSHIKGPIVIKLHGSPLHSLPEPLDVEDETMPVYARFEHALVLSEQQFLDNIVWTDPLPQFFNRMLLQEQRGLYFLGHSVKEWNTRLSMYSQVHRPGQPVRSAHRVAISRSHDPYRSAMLSAIGIHRWVGELEEITKVIDKVLM